MPSAFHGTFGTQFSFLHSVDGLATSLAARMGKAEKIRVVDARTQISRERRRSLSRHIRPAAPGATFTTSLSKTPQALLVRRPGIRGRLHVLPLPATTGHPFNIAPGNPVSIRSRHIYTSNIDPRIPSLIYHRERASQ